MIAGVSRNDLPGLNMLAEAQEKPHWIVTELGLTTGSVTALLDRLEKANLARRGRDPDDCRGAIVHLTPHLFEILGPVYCAVAREIEKIATTYADDERRASVRQLDDASSAYELAFDPGCRQLSSMDIGAKVIQGSERSFRRH